MTHGGDGSKCDKCGRVIRPFEARKPLDVAGTRFEHAPACPAVRY